MLSVSDKIILNIFRSLKRFFVISPIFWCTALDQYTKAAWPVQTESANDKRAEGFRHLAQDDTSHNAQLLPKHCAYSCSEKPSDQESLRQKKKRQRKQH